MEEFILSGQAIDLVLLVIAVEFVGLLFLRRKSWRRAAPDLFLALMPGVLLLVALRLALTGSGWEWIALAVAASFPFHIADLVRRHSA
jgi:hypothetical protein